MPLGRYSWEQVQHRHLCAVDYEEVSVTSGQVGFTVAKVNASEFGMLRVSGGPIRCLWIPQAAAVLANNFGVIFYDNTFDVFNQMEMRFFLATLQAGAASALLQMHYYSPTLP